jgi:hypothetical protein
MERGNSKHSGRVDDEMEHEVESLTRGAPVEARVEEHLEKEGAGDGEPVPQEVLRTTNRGDDEER